MEELGKPKEVDLGRLRTMYEERTKELKRSKEEDQYCLKSMYESTWRGPRNRPSGVAAPALPG